MLTKLFLLLNLNLSNILDLSYEKHPKYHRKATKQAAVYKRHVSHQKACFFYKKFKTLV